MNNNNEPIFLDYGKIIEVQFNIQNDLIEYQYVCHTNNQNFTNTIMDNLQKVSSLD